MPKIEVAYFLEDAAQERFVPPLVRRIAEKDDLEVSPRVYNATGGKGPAIKEFERFLSDVKTGRLSLKERLLVVSVDGNCNGSHNVKKAIQAVAKRSGVDIDPISAVPDPHIERWFLLDGPLLQRMWGCPLPILPKNKCDRDRYKQLLAESAAYVGSVFGGVEYGEDIAQKMDMDKAVGQHKDFKDFVHDTRTSLSQVE